MSNEPEQGETTTNRRNSRFAIREVDYPVVMGLLVNVLECRVEISASPTPADNRDFTGERVKIANLIICLDQIDGMDVREKLLEFLEELCTKPSTDTPRSIEDNCQTGPPPTASTRETLVAFGGAMKAAVGLIALRR